jgi:DNA ligase-1
MNIYGIIQSLHSANGTIEKQAILDSHKDNVLFKNYMKAVLDPGINYYIKKLPKTDAWPTEKHEFSQLDIDMMMELAERKYTGLDAHARLGGHASAVHPETRTLMQYMLDHKLGKTSVGETMALKTWPGLFFTVPYQRCSLLDAKARERFGKLKRFFVQTKADGMFAYVVRRLDGSVDVITRAGSKFPQWFAEKVAYGLAPGKVLVGELLVGEMFEGPKDVMLPRKTANGILTSCLKDGEGLEQHQRVHMEAWDLLTQEEFEAGKSSRPYEDRLDTLWLAAATELGWHVSVIFTQAVTSLEQAFAIYQEHLQRGLEGCIIKDPASLWKDGTAKDIVKLKLKFKVEARCVGMYEGEGKAAGMLGGINVESEDGLMKCNCGSGFSDEQRKYYWEHPGQVLQQIVELEANDITQARDSDTYALSLPIFEEVRTDKSVADTLQRMFDQLEAAKRGD